jgi:hypothetical protein
MRYDLQRLYYTRTNPRGNYSMGFMANVERTFRSLSLEDTHQDGPKIPGITRIPSGFYTLGLRRVVTPLTEKHRADYAKFKRPDGSATWFSENPEWFHIEILNVPNFSGVYIHSGVDDEHTLGCVLPAYSFDMLRQDRPSSNSLLAVDDFYRITHPILDRGGIVHLVIHDEPNYNAAA